MTTIEASTDDLEKPTVPDKNAIMARLGTLLARVDAFDPMVPRTFTLLRTRQDTRDTYTLELEPTDGVPLRFQAGQFTMLHAFGVGEVPISIKASVISSLLSVFHLNTAVCLSVAVTDTSSLKAMISAREGATCV